MIGASILLYSSYGGVLMRSKRIPAEEQYRLIMECRQSGLTDHQRAGAGNGGYRQLPFCGLVGWEQLATQGVPR